MHYSDSQSTLIRFAISTPNTVLISEQIGIGPCFRNKLKNKTIAAIPLLFPLKLCQWGKETQTKTDISDSVRRLHHKLLIYCQQWLIVNDLM